MNIFMRVLLAVDQGACLILTGQNDLSLSAWAYAKKIEDGVFIYNDVINKLFFWQKEHCKEALKWEYQEAAKLKSKLYSLYQIASIK
jgi:hypothetical protein